MFNFPIKFDLRQYMIIQNNERKLGSNTSGLRMIFTWWRVVCAFTLNNNTSQKNRPWWRVACDFTLHNTTSQKNRPWWRVRCPDSTLHNYITVHHKRIDLDEGWCATLHYITLHHKRIDLDEGWCATLHYITIHHKRIDLDEGWCATVHYNNNTSQKNRPWWRGGVRLYTT